MRNKKWAEITIKDFFEVKNAKPLHKVDLNTNGRSIPYITRSQFSNGFETTVDTEKRIYLNPQNTITFGAESVKFFFQPYDYYTGNKIYYVKRKDGKQITFNIGLFLITVFQNSLVNTGYGFGMGLTGARFKERKVKLPMDKDNNPDWDFMENYIAEKSNQIKATYQLPKPHNITDHRELDEVEWEEYFIDDIIFVKSGVRLTKDNQYSGSIPFVGATDNNNGITEFINNTNSSTDKEVLGVNYNGSIGYAFYHPYTSTFSDDVKRLSFKENRNNQYTLLFLKHIIEKQAKKYAYGYKFNKKRMKRQIIKLPSKQENNKIIPDLDFMENYMKRLENKLIAEKLSSIENW